MIVFSTRRWPFLSSGTPYPLLLSLFLLTATIQSSRPGLAQGQKPATSTSARASGRSKQDRGDIARFGERVQAAIASGGSNKAFWGVSVSDAENGEQLSSRNAAVYF